MMFDLLSLSGNLYWYLKEDLPGERAGKEP